MLKKTSPIKTKSPYDLPKFANVALGGVAGSGKTHLLGTVGPKRNVLIFDTENGADTYKSPAFLETKTAAPLDNIHLVTFDDVDDPKALIHRIEGAFDHLIRTKNRDGFDVVAVDSVTELQERFMSLSNAPDIRQDYKAFRDSLYSLVTKARQLPAHTIFTARLKATQDEVEGGEIVRFEMSPGAWSVVSGLFQVIGYLTVKRKGAGKLAKSVRNLNVGFGTKYQGKDRYGIGPELTDPTMVEVIQRIEAVNQRQEVKAA